MLFCNIKLIYFFSLCFNSFKFIYFQTHVNGMLHDSDMPSSASALYRNTRQKCMEMKIDKTNVSVVKR